MTWYRITFLTLSGSQNTTFSLPSPSCETETSSSESQYMTDHTNTANDLADKHSPVPRLDRGRSHVQYLEAKNASMSTCLDTKVMPFILVNDVVDYLGWKSILLHRG
ncbi:hypothetical protein K435DRAFT_859434 [Dendrothele bispora CBS 962.96]|uniref:Uncharacterized protein n=1 Tax=Dendrothele bispora (strain CBS 962.96) TaxID=1314807 RepID=A0A4S8M0Y7_DENBC|nr:hypothetical protein K435DRAFT_859434 [Dendrothele bispora CBS 962.96]